MSERSGAAGAAGAAGALDLTPAPGASPYPRRVLAYAGLELRQHLRNGEQLLLTLVIPVGVLVLFSAVPVLDLGARRIDVVAPGVLGLAVLSTAFTGQAIATGFERRYGALRRLGATPLGRPGLLAAKILGVLAVEAGQFVVLCLVAVALGWRPRGGPGWVALLLVLATTAFCALGLLLAGTLRAEATLAAANLVYVVLLAVGGVVIPERLFPAAVRPVLDLLPVTALVGGLRTVLQDGAAPPAGAVLVLAVWAVLAVAATARFFRWD